MRFGTVGLAIVVLFLAGGCGGTSDADRTKTAAAGQPTPTAPVRTSTVPATAAATVQPPAISIDVPAANANVHVPIDVRGSSNVFEGVLSVQLQQTDGTLLCERRVQSTSGTGTPGTWQTTIAVPPPVSAFQGTIRAFSRSARDGSEENVVTRGIVVAPDAPAIVILTPGCNVDIAAGTGLPVTGTASVFEAALSLELRNADGMVVASQPVTADASAPARGSWSAMLNISSLPAGLYELTAFDLSARDGSRENEFSIPLRITV